MTHITFYEHKLNFFESGMRKATRKICHLGTVIKMVGFFRSALANTFSVEYFRLTELLINRSTNKA